MRYSENVYVYYAGSRKRSDQMIKQIEKIKPELIYAVGLFSWHFTIVPLFFGMAKRKILSVKGMLHPEALAQKSLKKKLFLHVFKLSGLPKKIIFHATDQTEYNYIRSLFAEKANIMIADNFPSSITCSAKPEKMAGQLKLATIALISPMKNIDLILKALPKVPGNVEYNIYGAIKDMPYWQQCLALIRALPANIKVNYHGEIMPTAVKDKLQDNQVFILPSRSENYGHSIIEALSAGIPVITSHTTPWNGLDLSLIHI